MKKYRLIVAQILLVLCAAACAVTVLYVKCSANTEVGGFGAEYRSNLTLGDLADNLSSGGAENGR